MCNQWGRVGVTQLLAAGRRGFIKYWTGIEKGSRLFWVVVIFIHAQTLFELHYTISYA